MSHLPLAKLGALVIRTLTKPLAKSVKTKAKQNKILERICSSVGQAQHRVTLKMHLSSRVEGIKEFKIKELPHDQAVEHGADFIGEAMIFTVAAALVTVEYVKATEKSNAMAQEKLEQKAIKQNMLESRFTQLEEKVMNLERLIQEGKSK